MANDPFAATMLESTARAVASMVHTCFVAGATREEIVRAVLDGLPLRGPDVDHLGNVARRGNREVAPILDVDQCIVVLRGLDRMKKLYPDAEKIPAAMKTIGDALGTDSPFLIQSRSADEPRSPLVDEIPYVGLCARCRLSYRQIAPAPLVGEPDPARYLTCPTCKRTVTLVPDRADAVVVRQPGSLSLDVIADETPAGDYHHPGRIYAKEETE